MRRGFGFDTEIMKGRTGFKGLRKLRELVVEVVWLLGLHMGINGIAPASNYVMVVRGKAAEVVQYRELPA